MLARNITLPRASTTARTASTLTRGVLHACHGACDRWRIRATSAAAYGMVTGMESVTRRLVALAVTLTVALAARTAGAAPVPPAKFGNGVCAIADSTCGSPPMLAVVSAFPAELEAVLTHATVHQTLVIGDRVLRIGTLGDVPVVFALLGIGLENAGTTTDLVLDHFDVAGVVLSGVAGSAAHAIGDVTVPATWLEADGTAHPVDPSFLRIASAAAPGVLLERCTAVPPAPPGPITCQSQQPTVIVGGTGESDDPFLGRPFACEHNSDPVFGCDIAGGLTAAAVPAAATDQLAANDMETAAVARETQARGVPFIAFRAVSDTENFADFFNWYQLAADNAAAVTAAFVERWGSGRVVTAGTMEPSGPRASCTWPRLATSACATDDQAPRSLTAAVDRCCRLLAADKVNSKKVDRAWRRAARLAKQARRKLGKTCTQALSAALRERGGS
jgi:adenosylhomocysteine nucleosidase